MNIVKVEAYEAGGKRIDTARSIEKQGEGLWLVKFVEVAGDVTVDYCVAYDPEGRAERVPMNPLLVPAGMNFDVRIRRQTDSVPGPKKLVPVDPTDLLERLRGNGRPWTFAEIIAEIEKLRQMRMDVLHYASCLKAAHIAGPPEYDFDDEKEFVACILKAVL